MSLWEKKIGILAQFIKFQKLWLTSDITMNSILSQDGMTTCLTLGLDPDEGALSNYAKRHIFFLTSLHHQLQNISDPAFGRKQTKN